MTDELTWTCHVCGDERPDSAIDVFKTKRTLDGGIEVQTNVRYCNDRPTCIEEAPNVDFLGGVE